MLISSALQPVCEFLTAEMDLLDTWRLREWLDLFTPTGVYWLPKDPSGPRARENAIIYDDASQRQIRVEHVLVDHLAQTPRSRTLHVTSNATLLDGEPGTVVVRLNAIVFETRTGQVERVEYGRGAQRALPGQFTYVLRPDADAWKIEEKKIVLLARDEPQYNLTFIM